MSVTPDWNSGAHQRRFVASYSGGKDSSLALHLAMQSGEAIGLIVMLEEKGERSRSHDIDPCGEGGEFHTTVLDGPIFRRPVPVRKLDVVRDGEYAFLPLELDEAAW